MLVQRFEPQGRRFTNSDLNFYYYYYINHTEASSITATYLFSNSSLCLLSSSLTTTTTTLHFSPMAASLTPWWTEFVYFLRTFFWIVSHCHWHQFKFGFPLFSKHVFFVAFNPIARNIHSNTNHFIWNDVPHHHGMENQQMLKTWWFKNIFLLNQIYYIIINEFCTLQTL